MKTIITALSISLLFGACSDNEQSNNEQFSSIALSDKTIDSFQKCISNFEFKRLKVYGDPVDEFHVEKEFENNLTSTFKSIEGYSVNVMFNKYDSVKRRRDMMLIDKNSSIFYAVVPEIDAFKSILPLSTVKIKGEMLGFKLTRDNENPNLEIPEFIIKIESVN